MICSRSLKSSLLDHQVYNRTVDQTFQMQDPRVYQCHENKINRQVSCFSSFFLLQFPVYLTGRNYTCQTKRLK